jgi:hypothetical protein
MNPLSGAQAYTLKVLPALSSKNRSDELPGSLSASRELRQYYFSASNDPSLAWYVPSTKSTTGFSDNSPVMGTG